MSVVSRQIIVVGAGPVGLLTALGLARQGVEVTVLDSEPEVVRSPRAAVYFHTTISILKKLGLSDEAHEIGLTSTEFKMHWLETGEVMSSDMRDALEPGQEFDHNLHFGQHILAELVMRHLALLPNTEVLWNHTVKALGQDGRKARVLVDTEDGEVTFEADWIIGTDGARSTVRKLAGLPFEGFTWPDRFVATNIEYPFLDFGFCNANMVVDPVNWAVIGRLGRENLWRLTYGEDAELSEASILERLPERFAAILPDPSVPYRIDNFSPYRVHQRCAPSFRVERVLLAGDAAHACNPCGGLGLTGGVIDADTLSDTLGAVIAGRANEGVLDFYSAERRRVFLEVTSPMSTNFKRLLSESDPARRQQDKAEMFAQADKGGAEVRASSLAELIKGAAMPVGPLAA
ncbi:FAD-dependent monooxygenase [Croceibacterium sp. LX-88]|uniref:FAD-dependent monooxygenase n=1 Tax=Croceibacterium selenioxidans TaxID=2838833 RepID=A0ABS5W8H6_9SPHN|nr:FAD-dependent oxidoreductase [Croceibacterium selenioxidans]MBT2135387.1 FAD-dependent monooxygenase [Croceibacterium selenioxidans]